MLHLNNRSIGHNLRRDKTVTISGSDFTLNGEFDNFVKFTKSWEDMGVDQFYGQAKHGTRYRRYSDFNYNPVTHQLTQLEHRAYEQSLIHNKYVGGIERHFNDFDNNIITSPILQSLVKIDFNVYKEVLPEKLHTETWQCQIHQIRIEIKPDQKIEITPEGIHCDGYPFSGVHFWGRHNVEGAQSQIFTKDEILVDSGTYQNILDTTFFLDREMLHYVTPAINPTDTQMGFRQIIAVSFSRPGSEYDIIK
ncbi:2OG-Fe dioxygenase family protein [Entomobacter blattae]|uniref:2OG-Fe dioxygenase n=1 Tax=Entomobacter blattae TaxID=2762277 RepID=A0A7H1NRJ9_9PROT|nr:2OG-Fe dioxygenase family protein [Entomobacter blattae]QNT78409.1 2OG-Fe dioxygenase [Entomobacter blattae]